MKIDAIRAYLLRLPFKTPQTLAGRTEEFLDTVYVGLSSGGVTGWSEVAPGNSPLVTGEWSQGVFMSLTQNIFPILAENSGVQTAEKLEELFAPIRGNRQAIAAIDMAWWDLKTRLDKVPLWKGIGGQQRPIELGLCFDRCEEIRREEFFAQLQRCAAERFRRVTLKYRPGWEVEPVRVARQICSPVTELVADFEGVFTMETVSERLYRLQDFFPITVEQPIDPSDLVGSSMLQEGLRMPLALDEAVCSPLAALLALDLAAGRKLCIKPGRVGGLTAARQIAHSAFEHEVPCYAAMDLLTPLGYRAVLAAASLEGFSLAADYARFDEIFDAPISGAVPYRAGGNSADSNSADNTDGEFARAELWEEPGIGIDPAPELLEECFLDSFEVEL